MPRNSRRNCGSGSGPRSVGRHKVIAGGSARANERAPGRFGHGPRGIGWASSVRRSDRHGDWVSADCRRSPHNRWFGPDVTSMPVCSRRRWLHRNLLSAQTTWPSALRRLGRFVSFDSAKLNSCNLVAIDAPRRPPKPVSSNSTTPFGNEINRRGYDAIGQYKRVGVDRCDEAQQDRTAMLKRCIVANGSRTSPFRQCPHFKLIGGLKICNGPDCDRSLTPSEPNEPRRDLAAAPRTRDKNAIAMVGGTRVPIHRSV